VFDAFVELERVMRVRNGRAPRAVAVVGKRFAVWVGGGASLTTSLNLLLDAEKIKNGIVKT
jgi:hypothetical protein